MSLFLNFRMQPVGGGLRAEPMILRTDADIRASVLDLSTLQRLVSGRSVLLAVHGFNNGQSEALCKLTRLEEVLALPPSVAFIGVLWPGDSAAGFISYPVEKPTASASGQRLAKFCNNRLPATVEVSILSHSLGARVALETVRGLRADVRAVVLMAGAIERNCLEKEYSDAFAKAEAVHVLASRKDNVLRWAFPAGNFFGQLLDRTAWPLSSALGYSGPPKQIGKTRPPWIIDDEEDYDHGDYLPSGNKAEAFPGADPAPTWRNTAAYVGRALSGNPQIWP
ncbi:alpha/beta hydrolase [Rhizobium sp. G21]|uniref:alpha/beta hydrolase n=1 Tax=Rhizobium sp. G21 TaxID=2758439 RepID=UPI001600B3F8|nr:alpha/beta hydrolase [Rhizobium sp. G21]MBB1247379.1 alpha/beta hydrolase [Rhizobium sp. G21]